MFDKWLRAMGDGAKLRCPSCRKGSMAKNFWDLNAECPHCGVSFEPNEGDFLGAIVVAYSIMSVFIAAGVFILLMLTDLSAYAHIAIWSTFAFFFLVFGYRNMKGIWIGVLYAMTDLRKRY